MNSPRTTRRTNGSHSGNGLQAEPAISQDLLETPGFLLSQSGRLIRDKLMTALKPVGIVPQELAILRLLVVSREPISQQAIGAKCNLDKTTVTELVDGLEGQVYVRRQVSAKDRRSKIISITASGRRVLNKAEKLATVAEENFTSLMTEREWSTVRKCLIRFIEEHS